MKIKILKADITALNFKVDAIVNAANKRLMGGGGVDGAIHSRAGPDLAMECRKKLEDNHKEVLNTGSALITDSFGLRKKAKYIIHTVGPIYDRDEIGLLRDCYKNCLRVAEDYNCKSIAFPAISTGVYRVPVDVSARIVRETLDDFVSDVVEEIYLVLYDEEAYKAYKNEFGVE